MRMRFQLRIVFVCLLFWLAQAGFSSSSLANERDEGPSPTPGTVHDRPAKQTGKVFQTTIPVFFATDRRQEAPELVFKEQVTENPYYLNYGVIAEKVKLKNFLRDGKFKSCSFTHVAAEAGSEHKSVIFPKMPDNSTFDFSQLLEKLKQADSNSKGVIVHVHGCCMGFTHAAVDAALTSAWLDAPVVLYDWGSPFGAYAGSLQACERSQARFNKFMDKLSQELPPEKITIVGFSLGNQLIVDYLLQTEEKRRYKDWILTRPDLDLVTFQSHLPKLSSKAQQIHLYLAKNDFVLHCSGGLRKLVSPWATAKRVGDSKTGFSNYENVTVLDVSKVDGLHTIPNAVMADLYKNSGTVPESSDRFKYTLESNGIFEVSRK